MGRNHPKRRPRRKETAIARARRALYGNDVATAIGILQAAAKRDPDNATLLETLAEAYERGGRTLDALRQLDHIISIDAATATTWKRTGQLLTSIREYAQAVGAYARSVELDGSDAEVRHDYGRALYKLGDLAGAAAQLEQATQLTDEAAPWLALATAAPGILGYSHADVLRIRRTLAAQLVRIFRKQPNALRTAGSSNRLRIGYLSGWFDHENYMKPVWGLINTHDRSQFEIHLFSDTSPEQGFPGYEPYVDDRTHLTRDLDNVVLAEVIGQAGIDILVDLNGYSTPERLSLFLSRPAPVTAAWFNMYATSGFPGFDYIIGDHVTVRPEEEIHYCEKVLRLPQSYLSFIVTHDSPPIVDPPSTRNGYVTFGSLAPQYKLTAPVLDAWAVILQTVPTARLLLGNTALDSACNRDYVADRFTQRGIDATRLELRGHADHRTFLEYYNAIDIALDTFPYNGGTTTMEAIWQGVPVVTFDGDRWASRTSASILARTHLAGFVAADVQGYVRIAVELANDPIVADRLRRLRISMRELLADSAVCDTRALARAMESLYREMAVRD